ncbi:riboflavin synthase [Ignicoccus islandicus DSM 13165]|uniref:Riboflavin synthase n=1 Tax=Ignicoccus islandicus DSM 13165 TaxID=940295 RepID=A0A0U3E1C1_9CREN|nr:riboflavin synthase [Ignicoccus islandicus]ALU11723.1 riboflavin synthase [Ignicoccus islandicus DSM 13165]
MVCVAIVDTTFSRVDMASEAIKVLRKKVPGLKVKRYTVPGIKDIAVAVKKLFDEGCDAAMTFGWVGPTQTDKYSYLAMSIALQMVQINYGRHVIDVTVHEDEAEPIKLKEIALGRAREHAENLAVILTKGPQGLTPLAGTGQRQGWPDVGPL